MSEDRLVDLVEEQFAVAIRSNPRPDTGLVGRCFAKDRLVGAAPSHPGAVLLEARGVSWHRDGQLPRQHMDTGRLVLEPVPKLRLSSFLTVRDAALAGAGVALLPQSIAWNEMARCELVQWGTVVGGEVSLWVLHTSRRLLAPKVRAFVDFMCAALPGRASRAPELTAFALAASCCSHIRVFTYIRGS